MSRLGITAASIPSRFLCAFRRTRCPVLRYSYSSSSVASRQSLEAHSLAPAYLNRTVICIGTSSPSGKEWPERAHLQIPPLSRYVASSAPMCLQCPLGKRVYASVSTQPFRTLFTISFSSADSIPSKTVSTLPARHTSRLTILSWRPLSARGRLPPSRAGRSACPRQSSR